MNILTTTISLKIEKIDCYYLCKHTYQFFDERWSGSKNLMISKNTVKNEMIIICIKIAVILFKEYFLLVNVILLRR